MIFLQMQITNMVWSLATLGAKWEELSCVGALLCVLPGKMRVMEYHNLASVVYSLGLLGAEWRKLPSSVMNGLVGALRRSNKDTIHGTKRSNVNRSPKLLQWDEQVTLCDISLNIIVVFLLIQLHHQYVLRDFRCFLMV